MERTYLMVKPTGYKEDWWGRLFPALKKGVKLVGL
jgi:nucleoside diphosphate kinase